MSSLEEDMKDDEQIQQQEQFRHVELVSHIDQKSWNKVPPTIRSVRTQDCHIDTSNIHWQQLYHVEYLQLTRDFDWKRSDPMTNWDQAWYAFQAALPNLVFLSVLSIYGSEDEPEPDVNCPNWASGGLVPWTSVQYFECGTWQYDFEVSIPFVTHILTNLDLWVLVLNEDLWLDDLFEDLYELLLARGQGLQVHIIAEHNLNNIDQLLQDTNARLADAGVPGRLQRVQNSIFDTYRQDNQLVL